MWCNGCISESTNQIDLDQDRFIRRGRSSPMKKYTFVSLNAIFITFVYTIMSYGLPHPMISHNTWSHPVPWFATFTSHASSWAWLTKISPWSQIFLRCLRADLDLILNVKRLAWSWTWTNLERLDWSDVWFCTYPVIQFKVAKWQCSPLLNEGIYNNVFVIV